MYMYVYIYNTYIYLILSFYLLFIAYIYIYSYICSKLVIGYVLCYNNNELSHSVEKKLTSFLRNLIFEL